jgi:hypothetical protein
MLANAATADAGTASHPTVLSSFFSLNGIFVLSVFAVAVQPLEEIRDYFGDDLGLYFSWIGLYTRMLGVCSIFGVLVMCAQPFYGGVEKNPFTLAYSIYVGMWSISFLETWTRRENELRFLWGTAQLSSIEEPRSSFEGILETNIETGRQMMVHTSTVTYSLKMAFSYVVCFIFIVITILSALGAQLVRYVEPTNGDGISCADIDANLTLASLPSEPYVSAGGSNGSWFGASDSYDSELVACSTLQWKQVPVQLARTVLVITL